MACGIYVHGCSDLCCVLCHMVPVKLLHSLVKCSSFHLSGIVCFIPSQSRYRGLDKTSMYISVIKIAYLTDFTIGTVR